VAAIRVITALSGDTNKRGTNRFQSYARGARILHEKRDLYDLLVDHDREEAMPDGSLGRVVVQ